MLKAGKIALAAVMFAIVTALSPLAHKASAQVYVEVNSFTNPWITSNENYCTDYQDMCLLKNTPKDTNKISPRLSRYAPPPPPKNVVASVQVQTAEFNNNQVTFSTPHVDVNTTSLDSDLLFQIVNEYRTQNGLTPFEKDENLCSIARSRTPQLYNEILGTGWMHKGFQELNLSYWATENIIYEFSEQKAFNWWRNSYVHNSSMLGDYRYSCTACQGNTCAQIFTNYSPKVLSTQSTASQSSL